jgi:hypothetical protein
LRVKDSEETVKVGADKMGWGWWDITTYMTKNKERKNKKKIWIYDEKAQKENKK